MNVRASFFAAAACLLATGCTSSGRIGPQEFLRSAELERIPEPMHAARLIGVTGDRAELEVWDEIDGSRPSRRIVWCPLSELPLEIAEELRSEKNPWAH